jgi:S-formylglutathione hydrolase FrmB
MHQIRRRAALVVAVLLATMTASLVTTTTSAGAQAPPFQSGFGITVRGSTQQGRVHIVDISTSAIDPAVLRDGANQVVIILPENYNPALDYPVIYMHHGNGGNEHDWRPAMESLTAGKQVITVLPESGVGWGANWPQDQRQKWLDFHTSQLVPWVDANLSTIAGRQGRVVAGFSMGGFEAIYEASKRPDLFSYAAGFSSGYDLNSFFLGVAISGSVAMAGLPASGPFAGNAAQENPQTHLDRFRGVHVSLWAGTGFDFIEPFARSLTQSFNTAMRGAGNDVSLTQYNCAHNAACVAQNGVAVEIQRILDTLPGP